MGVVDCTTHKDGPRAVDKGRVLCHIRQGWCSHRNARVLSLHGQSGTRGRQCIRHFNVNTQPPKPPGQGSDGLLGSAELSAAVATVGILPTPEEYMKCYAELGSESGRESIYKYLNFDQVESYVEAAADVA